MIRTICALLVLAIAAAPAALAQGFGGEVAASEGFLFAGEAGNTALPATVYVYEPGENGWTETARLTNPEGDGIADRFGSALSADGHHVLVGASESGANVGAAFIFGHHEDGFEMAHRLTPDGMVPSRFGRSVSIKGHTAVVGSDGFVFVFEHAEGTEEWTQTAALTIDDVDATFGSEVAVAGNHIMVAAPGENDGAGAVYAYHKGDGGWEQLARLSSDVVGEGGALGMSIALMDGYALIAAPRAQRRVGMVLTYDFDAESGEWAAGAVLAPPAFSAGGRGGPSFGSGVAMDAGGVAWIGAPGDAMGYGTVFKYQWDYEAGLWSAVSRLDLGELQPRASAGTALAVGSAGAIVGATRWDGGEGAAIAFDRTDDGWARSSLLINEGANYASVSGGQVECEEDAAGGFPCKDIDMQSFLSVRDLGGERGIRMNDVWGWEDPETGREYALVGLTNQAAFVDVTDAFNPVLVGNLYMTEGANASVWRDIKVYKEHAYIVADGAGPHGMQVFDLAHLRQTPASEMPKIFDADFVYTEIASSHNIVINEETGFGYSVGGRQGGITCGGGLHMVDLRDPKSPTFAGCFSHEGTGRRGNGETHDAQCVIYNGPDADHRGSEVCFGSNETALSIADVSDKENPVALSLATYPSVAYTHQGWLTEDHRYFYINDEGDEPQRTVPGTRTLIFDVSDLDDPILVKEHFSDNSTSTDHNLYVRGNLMYQSNYVAGLRILDISDPENPVEVAYFDTVPYGENAQGVGGGSWSNYPYFQSGSIIVTSSREGLFVVKKKAVDI